MHFIWDKYAATILVLRAGCVIRQGEDFSGEEFSWSARFDTDDSYCERLAARLPRKQYIADKRSAAERHIAARGSGE